MTLLTRHIEAGWKEVEVNVGKAAERLLSRPGATASTIRVEAPSQSQLHEAIDLREHQLTGTEQPIKDTITDDGTVVTGDQHESLKTDGVTTVDAALAQAAESGATVTAPGVTDTEPVPSSDELRPEDVQVGGSGIVAEGVADTETYKPGPSAPAGAAPSDEPESPPTPSADAPLTDEERAKIAADEAALEAQFSSAPTDDSVDEAASTPGAADDSVS